MYPNLRYAFYDVFGIDLPFMALVQTYGFLLALTFLACGLALSSWSLAPGVWRGRPTLARSSAAATLGRSHRGAVSSVVVPISWSLLWASRLWPPWMPGLR